MIKYLNDRLTIITKDKNEPKFRTSSSDPFNFKITMIKEYQDVLVQ